MLALLDNTVLSNFAIAGRPDVIQRVLGVDAATTEAVWQEYLAGVQIGRVPAHDWSRLTILLLEAADLALYEDMAQRLNAGEASCLAIAARLGARVCTDDRDAREIAISRAIPVSGTLGLLVRAIDLAMLSLNDADALLSRMIASGYRSPVTSLQQLM